MKAELSCADIVHLSQPERVKHSIVAAVAAADFLVAAAVAHNLG